MPSRYCSDLTLVGVGILMIADTLLGLEPNPCQLKDDQ